MKKKHEKAHKTEEKIQGNRMKFFTRNRHCFFWPNPSTVSI